jgi:hypothetical protein
VTGSGAGLRLSVLGTRFVVSGGAEVLAEAARLLAPFGDGVGGLAANGPPQDLHVGRAMPPTRAVAELVAHLNATALSRVDCLAVHAGVVARGGQVVAFPASSGSGKSTLVAACLRTGLDYVSDEALCIDWTTAAIRGYPRPIALSTWACTLLGLPGPEDSTLLERFATPAELTADLAPEPLTLAHIVLLDRQPGVSAELRPATRQETAAALLERSFTHWKHPERAFDLAHYLATTAQPWRLTLGDPRAAAPLLAGLFPAPVTRPH